MRRPQNLKKLKIFKAPVDEKGKPYWVPIVVKNKEYLIGYLECYRTMCASHGLNPDDLIVALGSDRLNDILPDGSKIKNLTRIELKRKVKDMMMKPVRDDHPENQDDLYMDNALAMGCKNCGMFYLFKEHEEIPENDFACSCCSRELIIYTETYDDDFDYDGEEGQIEEIVSEIQKELLGDEED